ncbi:PI-PLC X domain-containing protein-like protein [Tanacetum coccineum]
MSYRNLTTKPAINVLKEVQAFLEANPTEIITIIIEDYVTTQSGLIKIFKDDGLVQEHGEIWREQQWHDPHSSNLYSAQVDFNSTGKKPSYNLRIAEAAHNREKLQESMT